MRAISGLDKVENSGQSIKTSLTLNSYNLSGVKWTPTKLTSISFLKVWYWRSSINRSPPGMNSRNNIGEVALQIINISNGLIHIFLNLLNNFIQLVVVDGEVVLEHSNSLLTSLGENHSHLIDEVDLGDDHSGEEWTDQCPVFEVGVDFDCF